MRALIITGVRAPLDVAAIMGLYAEDIALARVVIAIDVDNNAHVLKNNVGSILPGQFGLIFVRAFEESSA